MSSEPTKTVLDKLLDYYGAVVALRDQSEESEYPVQVEVREYRSETSLLIALTLLDLNEHNRPIPLSHRDQSIHPADAWMDAAKKLIEAAQKKPHKPIIIKTDALRIKLDETEDYLQKRDILLEEYNNVLLRLGHEAGLLRQIQEVQAHMPYLSTENTIIVWRQAPDVSDVRTRDAWGSVKASVKTRQQSIFMFRQDKVYEKTGARYVESVYDVSQTTYAERWETPTSQAVEHVRALAKLGSVDVAHFNKGFGEDKIVENRPSENMLLINVSADKNQLVLMAAAIIAERLLSNKKNIFPEERNLVSILAAQLYAIRHSFGAYDRTVDDKVEAQLRARLPEERSGILEIARQMALDMTTRTEVALEEEASKEKGGKRA